MAVLSQCWWTGMPQPPQAREPTVSGATTHAQGTSRSSAKKGRMYSHGSARVRLRSLTPPITWAADSTVARRGCAGARFSPYPYPSEVGDRRFSAILEPVDEPKPRWTDRFRPIRAMLAGEVEAYRSNPPPPRSGPRGRGGDGTTIRVTVRSRSLVSWRSSIPSRTVHARRSASTSLFR